MFDLLVGLANDQSIMGDRSQEEQALMKIQHEWAEARVKGDIDRHICETGRSMEGGRFANHSGLGQMIAHSYR